MPPFERRARPTPGRSSSSERAATLAASTSGWSNGLMPSRRPGDRDRVLPGQQHRAEGVDDLDLAVPHLAGLVEVANEAKIWRSARSSVSLGECASSTDRQDALPELAGGLRDELLRPVAEFDDVGTVRHDAQLVLQRLGARDRRTEHQPGVVTCRRRARSVIASASVEVLQVDSGQARRDQTERGQAPSSDRRRSGRR